MKTADPRFPRLQSSLELHQATDVARDHRIDSQRLELIDLVVGHTDGDSRKIDAEGSAEAAAPITGFRFDHLETADCGKEPPRLVLNAQLSETVTGIVPGHSAEPAGLEALRLKPANQKGSQLHRGTRDPGRGFRISLIAFPVEEFDRMPKHRDAGSRWRDDDFASGVELGVESVNGSNADGGRLTLQTRVEGGLSATGLPRVVVDGAAAPLEDLDRGFGGRRPELIDETRDEEGDPHH